MTKENIDKINNLIDKKQYDEALRFSEELLKENDKDAEIYYYIGNIYSSSKKYDKSIEYYDKTIGAVLDNLNLLKFKYETQ